MCSIGDYNEAFEGYFGDIGIVSIAYTSEMYTFQSEIQFHYRDCLPGEIKDPEEKKKKKCIPCQEGQYSLNPNDKKCKDRPDAANKSIRSLLVLKNGYWRRNVTTDVIHACNDATDNENTSRCEGGFFSQCKDGYMGSVCHQCNLAQGFVRTGLETKIECRRCRTDGSSSTQEESESILPLLLLYGSALFYFGVFLAFEIYIITRAVRAGREFYDAIVNNGSYARISAGPYLNLIVSYLQIITIVSSFEVEMFRPLFNLTAIFGDPAAKISFSLDCLFIHWGLDPQHFLRTKIILLIASPIVKLLVIILYYAIKGLNKDRKIIIVVAALSLFSLEQPQIIKKLISYVICNKLVPDDEKTYVQNDEYFACDGDAYYHFKYAVVVPCLLFFCLLPLSLFLMLFIKKRRDELDTEWMRKGAGVLYNGYTTEAYYWNLIVNYSKIGLIILTQVYFKYPNILVFLLVVWFYIYMTLISRIKPYLEQELVTAEKYSLYAYWVTVFCSS